MAYKQVLLGDFFKFEKGLGYKGEFLVDDSEVGLVGIDSQVPGGGYKENSEKPYSGPYKPEHIVQSGDVIVTSTDITQDGSVLGSTFMIPESTKYETLIYSGDVLKVIPTKPEEFSPEYLYNLYRVEKYRRKLAYGDTGTTVRRISDANLNEQLVPLPDVKTQESINEVISLIDQQIENNKSLAKNLETLAQSFFRSWFVDFDPVHAKARGEKPFGMDDETAALFPDSFEESESGLIPKGWTVGPVDELLTLQGGFAFKSKDWKETGVPVIKIGSVKPGYLDMNQVSYISEDTASRISEIYSLPRGSLVIGLSGYVGEVGLVQRWSPIPLLNQRVAKFGLKNGSWSIPFTYCLTRDPVFKTDVINAAVGSAQQNVSNGQILSIVRPIPDSRILDRFNQLFDPLFDNILESLEQIASLNMLLNNLLPRLVSGEIQNIEKAIRW
jgi:type I restriction enzyme, S subunit